MSQPAILYRNILEEAANGRGSGEIMAYGTAAVISGMTFDLTTLNARGDLAAGNDVYNGMVLKFTASAREYLITDYVTATDIATVFETPNASDTADWTIRRSLWTADFDVAYPVRNVVNGRLYEYWKDNAANSIVTIRAFAPNGVDDGGFEMNSIDTYSSDDSSGTGTSAINATTPILGTYDCKLTKGDTYGGRKWTGKIDLKKGKTYGVICKAGGDGGVSTLNVKLFYVAYGDEQAVPTTFTTITGGDSTSNVGNGTDNQWDVAVTDANEWCEAKFTVPENIDTDDYELSIRCPTAATSNCFIDEVYLWEVIAPDTLIIGGHNMAGGFAVDSYVSPFRCAGDLTGRGAGDYGTVLTDLDANVQVDGKSPIYETFTAPTSIFPIVEIQFTAVSGKTWQAAEIHLGARWTWDVYPNPPMTLKRRSIESVSSRARGGPKVVSKLYQQKILSGDVEVVSSTEAAKWVLFIEASGHGKPFYIHVDAASNLGVTAETLLMQCKSVPDITEDPPVFYGATFSFEEAF